MNIGGKFLRLWAIKVCLHASQANLNVVIGHACRTYFTFCIGLVTLLNLI